MFILTCIPYLLVILGLVRLVLSEKQRNISLKLPTFILLLQVFLLLVWLILFLTQSE